MPDLSPEQQVLVERVAEWLANEYVEPLNPDGPLYLELFRDQALSLLRSLGENVVLQVDVPYDPPYVCEVCGGLNDRFGHRHYLPLLPPELEAAHEP